MRDYHGLMSGSWGCPHEVDGLCQRLKGPYCDPGMRGCVLDGLVTFQDGRSHVPRWPRRDDDEAPPLGTPLPYGQR